MFSMDKQQCKTTQHIIYFICVLYLQRFVGKLFWAGGGVLRCLRNGNVPWVGKSDVDLYPRTVTVEDTQLLVRGIVETLTRVYGHCMWVCSTACFTMYVSVGLDADGADPARYLAVQVMLRSFEGVGQVLDSYDIGACMFAYTVNMVDGHRTADVVANDVGMLWAKTGETARHSCSSGNVLYDSAGACRQTKWPATVLSM